jgi:hypothetical protein
MSKIREIMMEILRQWGANFINGVKPRTSRGVIASGAYTLLLRPWI